jgi:hypothetical protein
MAGIYLNSPKPVAFQNRPSSYFLSILILYKSGNLPLVAGKLPDSGWLPLTSQTVLVPGDCRGNYSPFLNPNSGQVSSGGSMRTNFLASLHRLSKSPIVCSV